MKGSTIKRALIMVAGALVIAIMITMIPSGFFADASMGLKGPKNVKEITKDVAKEDTTVQDKVVASDQVRVTDTKYLTLREAAKFALDKVDDDTAKITDYEISLTKENPLYIFEIETEKRRFDIEVHGVTGEIINFERQRLVVEDEEDDDEEDEKTSEEKDSSIKSNNGRFISKEDAVKFALEYVKRSGAKVTGFEIELEKEQPHYLVGIQVGSIRVVVKVDAESGEVYELVKDIREFEELPDEYVYKIRGNSDKIDLVVEDKEESIKDNKNNNKNNNKNKDKSNDKHKEIDEVKEDTVVKVKYISENEAKQIAIDKASIKSSNGYKFEIKFDDEDNPPQYEVKVSKGKDKYEIVIHAITGKVLSFKK